MPGAADAGTQAQTGQPLQPNQSGQHSQYNFSVDVIVLVLIGSSERDASLGTEVDDVIYLRHIFTSTVVE